MPKPQESSPISSNSRHHPCSLRILSQVDPHTLQAVTAIAQDLARNGCEGRDVGALFVVGDSNRVLERSYPLILDPLSGHEDHKKNVQSSVVQNTLRELAQLDGAFVITRSGTVVSAARCLDVRTQGLDVPAGLGSRHVAAASITRETDALAIVLSQGTPTVRMFVDGEIVDELHAPTRSRQEAEPTSTSSSAPRTYTPLTPRPRAGSRTRHRLPVRA